jgi:hypothetical protein
MYFAWEGFEPPTSGGREAKVRVGLSWVSIFVLFSPIFRQLSPLSS